MRRRLLLLSLVLVVAAGRSTDARETPAKAAALSNTDAAQRFVESALLAEIEGDQQGRELYLSEALEQDRSHALARWHSGYVQMGGKWVAIEEATTQAAAERRLREYRKLREAAGDTPREQFQLATWCRQHRLHDEARAHFFSALNREPNYASQAESFGLVQRDNVWMTREQAQQFDKRARRDRVAANRWRPKLARLKTSILREDNESKRALAREELLAIRDPEALSAVEAVFSLDHPPEALLAVALLENLPGQQAATVLTQIAVYNPAAEVRDEAAQALAGRSLYAYAPMLLAALQSPLEARFEQIQQPGSSTVRLTLLQEGPLADVVRNETLQVAPEGVSDPELSEMERNPRRERELIRRRAQDAVQRVQQTNAQIQAMNSRVENVLANAAGAEGSRARDYWEWWYNYNDIYYPPEYPTNEFSQTYSELYANVSECFIAGTPVWTATGLRPIEEIEVGDRVLSQDVETGELAFKPVLATSVRPPSELVKLTVSGEQFITTRGHPMWVNGQGWRMVKELSVGDRLHTAGGAVVVEVIESGPQDEAYNFVVGEFNNYFVGESKLLVHDNSLRQHTDAVMPGLVLRELK